MTTRRTKNLGTGSAAAAAVAWQASVRQRRAGERHYPCPASQPINRGGVFVSPLAGMTEGAQAQRRDRRQLQV